MPSAVISLVGFDRPQPHLFFPPFFGSFLSSSFFFLFFCVFSGSGSFRQVCHTAATDAARMGRETQYQR